MVVAPRGLILAFFLLCMREREENVGWDGYGHVIVYIDIYTHIHTIYTNLN